MTKERWHSLRNLLLILTALPCSRALEVSIPNKEYEVAKGGDITMTCTFIPVNPDANFLILTWEILPGNNQPVIPVATYFSDGHIDIGPKYEGRAILSTDIAKRESTLQINNVNQEDSQIFQCSLTIPNDDEGTTAATTSLLVLEAPSKPLCNLQGTAVYGNNISLTCKSENGFPTPTYAWQSHDVQNIPRQFPPRTTEKDGVLSLFNISMVTSGFYICASTNRIGSASCNFTLAVTPSSMNLGATAGIVVGVLAGIIVLAIILFCCCRKKEKQKHTEGSPETMEFHDKPSVEDGEQHWDDKSNNQTKARIEPSEQFEEKDVTHQSDYNDKVGTDKHKYEDDQHSYYSNKESNDGRAYDMDKRQDRNGGSRDRLDDSRGRDSGSRDRLDDSRGRNSGSRDRLDDHRDRYGGSRDRLDDSRGRDSGSRDRLDDSRGRDSGSRDRLDDSRGRDSGSRDRLDDHRDRYGGSRDRLDDKHDRYGGSREHLDERRDRYGGSDDRLSDKKRYG